MSAPRARYRAARRRFRRAVAERRIERALVLEVLRRQHREIILTALRRMAEQAPFYLFTAFVFAYGTEVLHLKRDFVLMAVLAAAMISFVSILLFGHLSGRYGRKRVYMLGAALTGAYGFAYFTLLDSRVPALVRLAIVCSLVPHDIMYGRLGYGDGHTQKEGTTGGAVVRQ